MSGPEQPTILSTQYLSAADKILKCVEEQDKEEDSNVKDKEICVITRAMGMSLILHYVTCSVSVTIPRPYPNPLPYTDAMALYMFV